MVYHSEKQAPETGFFFYCLEFTVLLFVDTTFSLLPDGKKITITFQMCPSIQSILLCYYNKAKESSMTTLKYVSEMAKCVI